MSRPPNRRLMISGSLSKAPLTMKSMWRVRTVRFGFFPASICCIICICPTMSVWPTSLTSVSSISFSRFTWTPRPETSFCPLDSFEAILSTSSM